jgi:hypothetical protein
MKKDQLKDILKKLHMELGSTEQVDQDLRNMLGELDGDIHRLLDDDTQDSLRSETLSRRAKEIAAKFSAQHPRAEKILVELADTLSKMGI